ncbi:MAG: hypothetical protein M3M84_06710 [Thermoproteota archaeon]|nr:hypothetical protein [Thermoproteota archaeon]
MTWELGRTVDFTTVLWLIVLSYYPIDSRQMAIIIIDINDNNNMKIKLTGMILIV